MAVFKFVLSQGKKSYQIEKEQSECPVMGKKVGEKFEGSFLGLPNSQLIITGGSDKDGFPLRPDMATTGRRKLLLTKGIGFRTKKRGLKRRKQVRGNTVSEDMSQINCKVLRSEKSLDEVFGKQEASAEKEEKKEEPKEEKQEPEKQKEEGQKEEEVKEEEKEQKPEEQKEEEAKEKKESKA